MTFLEQANSAARVGNLDEVLRLTIAHFRADTGTIHLLESDGGKGMAGLAVERKEPISVCNLQTDSSGDARPGAKATGMEGAIVVPIFHGPDAVGALGIASRAPRTFTTEETALLTDVGRAISSQWKIS